MFIDPVTLIDQTIENLELLAQLFADELDERTHNPMQVTPEAHRCREALGATRLAITKLQAARSVQAAPPVQALRVCVNCDD